MTDSSNARNNELLQLALRGNGDALGQILVRHRPYLRMLATGQIHERLRVKADASDVVQEACLQAHQNIASFRGQTEIEFAAWLRGILANLLAKHMRSFLGTKQRDIRLEETLAQSLDHASGCIQREFIDKLESPSTHMVRGERVLELASAIEQLPEDYRTIILLRHVQGLPFKEVAETMNRTVDSVEKLWVRGLAKLKQLLNGTSVE